MFFDIRVDASAGATIAQELRELASLIEREEMYDGRSWRSDRTTASYTYEYRGFRIDRTYTWAGGTADSYGHAKEQIDGTF